ncbi:MAG: helix-turn-helix domain-containing protein [bacterium]
MQAEIKIDTENLVEEIARKVTASLAPILNKVTLEENSVLTVRDLAKYLKVSPQWVYERVSLKEIPYSKLGKFPRFRKRKIDKWLNDLETPTMNRPSKPLKAVK